MVDDGRIECRLCGKRYWQLCVHLSLMHGVSADAYKVEFGLPLGEGLTSERTRQRKHENMVSRDLSYLLTPGHRAKVLAARARAGPSRIGAHRKAFLAQQGEARRQAALALRLKRMVPCPTCGKRFLPQRRGTSVTKYCSQRCVPRSGDHLVAHSRQLRDRRTHCVYGHEFTPENTYTHPSHRGRQCLICRRLRASGKTPS